MKGDPSMPKIDLPTPILYPVQLTSLLILCPPLLPDDGVPLALPPNLRTLSLPYFPRWQDTITALPESLHTLHFGGFSASQMR